MNYFKKIALVLAIICCFMTVSCQQNSNTKCPSCNAVNIANSKYCYECGYSFFDAGADSDSAISEKEKERIEQAVNLLVAKWTSICLSEPNNNGYLSIRNTRIIWPDSNSLSAILEIENVECIVEFIIYSDYYGSAPYYVETSYCNNVVFFSNGETAITQDVVRMYTIRTYDSRLERIPYSLHDYKSLYNQDYALKGTIADNT